MDTSFSHYIPVSAIFYLHGIHLLNVQKRVQPYGKIVIPLKALIMQSGILLSLIYGSLTNLVQSSL